MSKDNRKALTRTRIILGKADHNTPNNILRLYAPNKKEIMQFKAISLVTGYSRKNRNEYQKKVLGQTLLTRAIPGDSDRFRSPIRSAAFRAITPGRPGVGGSLPGENRASRCPEGYQYGGRFTNSQLSTCGAKLFDIPSAIGLSISALKKIGRSLTTKPQAAKPLTPGEYGEIQQGRQPVILIPKVAGVSRAVRTAKAASLVTEMGNSNGRFTRMVRRDGFSLQPVVPASVLRTIPDNRDMEGAHYIQSIMGQSEMGGEELGLLSNTGIQKLTYVLPGGSNISLEKVRELTVGERRKLGRTVNTANSISIANDPAARLKYVANETGDGMGYTEDFVNIRNPHQIVGDGARTREKWVNEVFGVKGNRRMKPMNSSNLSTRETASNAQSGKKITSIDAAMNHLNDGGTLSDISPKLLAQILSEGSLSKENKISASSSIVELGNRKYIYNKKPGKFEGISERFSEDMQQFLGLESPDIYLVGDGDNRKYLREDVESALIGARIQRDATWSSFASGDVAKLLVSDLVTDQRVRTSDSVVAMKIGDRTVPMASMNISGSLMDLDKIEISKRQKLVIDKLLSSSLMTEYSRYYQQLKTQDKVMMRKQISALLARAKKFNTQQYRQRLFSNGVSEGEKIHINMLTKLFEARINTLERSGELIRKYLEGAQ